jgi:GWxTD domain-containing protein
MNNKGLLYCIFIVAVFVLSCVPTSNVVRQDQTNHASLYNPSSSNIRPEVFFTHMASNSTYMFFKLNLNNMMTTLKADGSPGDMVVLDVKYVIRNVETKELTDSASLSYSVSRNDYKNFITYIPLNLEAGTDYYASIIFIDKNKQSWKRVLKFVNKTDPQAGEYFFPEYLFPKRIPVFSNYISGNQGVSISSEKYKKDSLFLIYYGCDTIIPLPAYSERNEKKFELKKLSVKSFMSGDSVYFPESGYYRVVQDTCDLTGGLEFVKANTYYPFIRLPEQMLPPLQYISTESQHRIIMKSDSLKLKLDEYWIKAGGAFGKARELIRIFYNRVQLANEYYTSTREGWQTDRGMVYVIFGNPRTIHKNEYREEWIYGSGEITSNLIFYFEKDTVSASRNDYQLIKNVKYKQAWGQAISTWRNGQAYSVK